MRSKHFWALSVRRPDKTIFTKLFSNVSLINKHKVLGFAFIRGVITLIESMAIGFKALSYSINEATEEEIKFSKKEMTISIIIAVAFAVGVFFVLPAVIGKSFSNFFPNAIVYNLLEGLLFSTCSFICLCSSASLSLALNIFKALSLFCNCDFSS